MGGKSEKNLCIYLLMSINLFYTMRYLYKKCGLHSRLELMWLVEDMLKISVVG